MFAVDKINSAKWLLKRDAVEFFRKSRMSVRAFAKGAGIAEKPARSIGDRGWDMSLRNLLMVEEGYRGDPRWPSARAIDSDETYDDSGFMVRRRFDPWSDADLDPALHLWNAARAGDEAALRTITTRKDVSVIDATATHPLDYRVTKHAPRTAKVSVDKTGLRLRETADNVYRKAQARDYLLTRATGEVIAHDIVYYVRAEDHGRVYRRLLMPMPDGMLLSLSTIYVKRVSGADAYSANISARDM